MPAVHNRLLILGCAERKFNSDGFLPALHRYDGPAYRVVRKYLRECQWPQDVSIAVLSAKYGPFGVLKGIEDYGRRMDLVVARSKAPECSRTQNGWATSHRAVHLSLGKDYLPALKPALCDLDLEQHEFDGRLLTRLPP